jgi:hypothetical protein
MINVDHINTIKIACSHQKQAQGQIMGEIKLERKKIIML